MWSRAVEARDEPGQLPVHRRRSAARLAVAVGFLALLGAGFLAWTGREKATDLAATWARGLTVSSQLEQLTTALRDSAAAARVNDAGEDRDGRAQKDAADRAGRALRELSGLVPAGSTAEDARARLDLLAKDALAADADEVQARRGDTPAGRNRPELRRLLAERAHAGAEELDRRMRQTADSQMADAWAGLLRDLGWLLAVLVAALVMFTGAAASLLQSPAQDRAVYLSAAEPPRVAPPMVQDVLDTLSDGVLVFDAHGKLLASSPSSMAILDLDVRGAGAGKRRGPPRGLYLPSDVAPESSVRNPLVRAIAGERVEGVEMSVGPPSNPESRRVILSARPVRDADGTRRGAAVALRDITDLKNAEAELAKARAEHAKVVLGHEQAIAAVAGEHGRLGAERLQAEEERDRAVTELKAAETGRKAAEASRGRAEGELNKAEAEVKKAKLVLQQNEERLVRLFEGLPVALVAVGADRSILRVNRAAADLLGASPSELQGTPLAVRLAAADPTNGARWRIIAGPLAGSPVRGETATVPDLLEGSVEVVALFPESVGASRPAEMGPELPAVGLRSAAGHASMPPSEQEWEAGADDVTGERRLREDQHRLDTRGAALVSKLREARLVLAALTTRPPVCPTCASDRAARGFWSRVAKAVEEASCPECTSLARKALPARRSSAESGRPAEDSLVGPAGDH